jgi:hypothetical protein
MEQQIKWLKRFLGIEPDELPTEPSDLYLRVVEIQARIATLRSSLEWTEKSHKNTSSQPKLAVAAEQQPAVTISPNDLKAKLLAMKK